MSASRRPPAYVTAPSATCPRCGRRIRLSTRGRLYQHSSARQYVCAPTEGPR